MARGRSIKIISMVKWIRTSRLSMKNPFSSITCLDTRRWRSYRGTSLIRNSTPLGPPWDLRHGSTVGSWREMVSYEQGTPVRQREAHGRGGWRLARKLVRVCPRSAAGQAATTWTGGHGFEHGGRHHCGPEKVQLPAVKRRVGRGDWLGWESARVRRERVALIAEGEREGDR